MKNSLLSLMIFLIIVACAKDEPQLGATRPPEIFFDPAIERFEGVSGEELRIGVKIEGESGFNTLVLERIENINSTSTDTLAFSTEGIPTPYFYDYRLILNEEDINKDFQLKFTVTHQAKTPGGGTAYDSHFKTLGVHVLASE